MNSGRVWPLAILSLLALNAAIVGVTLFLARAGAPVVEPDYYQRAVHWDREVARRRASDALGWEADIQVVLQPYDGAPHRSATLRLRLADASGRPVSGAIVRAEAFHHALAEQVRCITLASATEGRYEAVIEHATPGFWHVRIEAGRGEEHFRCDRSIETSTAEARQ